MASKKIKGIVIEIGGDTTQLGKALASAEKQSYSLQGELRQVEKLLQMDPGNTDLIAQRQKILADAVKETTEKLRILEKAQSQVEAQFKSGDIGADQYRAFQRELIKTQNELSSLETKAKDATDDVEKVGNSARDSGDGFTIMNGALADLVSNIVQNAISSIGNLIGSLMELSEATEEYRSMQAKLEGSSQTFGYSIDFANEKYKEFYKYLGDDQMATNAVTNLMGLGTSTESVSKLAEGATAVWASYGDSIPIESLTESMNETIKVGKVTGTFADTINWCKESNEGLNNALSGNKKAQKAFNDALKEGLPVEDAFNEALAKITDEQERADVVAKFLNDTYGESKKTYDEVANSVLEANEAELELKDTQAQLGETLAPVNNAFTDMKNKALEALAPLVETLSDAFMTLYEWLSKHPNVVKALTAVVIALTTAFTVLAGVLAIEGLINGVQKAWAFLNTTMLANPWVLVTTAIIALVAGIVYLWNTCEPFREFFINLWAKIKSATKTAVDAIVKFFTQTIPNAWNKFKTVCSNFITSIVNYFKSLPGKVSGALKTLISTVSNFFQQLPYKVGYFIGQVIGHIAKFGVNIINFAKTKIPQFVNSVVNFFKQLPGKIASAISGAVTRIATWGSNIKQKATTAIKSMVSSVVSTAKTVPSKIASALSGAVSRVGSWGSQMLSRAKSAMSSVVSGIKNTFSNLPSQMASIGRNLVQGIWNGISNAKSWVLSKIKSFGKGIVNGIKSVFGIHSPSTVMRDEVGKYLAEGIGVGITDNADAPIDAMDELTSDLTNPSGINGVTLNRQLNHTFTGSVNGGSVGDLVELAKEYFPKLIEASKHAIYLDKNKLIGETINDINRELGNIYALEARGVTR